MTLKECRACAREWQNALGLHEWDIEVHWGKPAAEPNHWKHEIAEDADAQIFWEPENPQAIVVLKKKSATRHCIVHELLHLRLEGHKNAMKAYDPIYERGINLLTCALLGEPEP